VDPKGGGDAVLQAPNAPTGKIRMSTGASPDRGIKVSEAANWKRIMWGEDKITSGGGFRRGIQRSREKSAVGGTPVHIETNIL